LKIKIMKTGIELIAEERKRQIKKEGFSSARDSVRHKGGELTDAAICYATVGSAQLRGSSVEEWPVDMFGNDTHTDWPWEDQWYKPSPHAERNLVKAGALIAAELDRIRNVDVVGGALMRYQDG
jgi:hypothetical protein